MTLRFESVAHVIMTAIVATLVMWWLYQCDWYYAPVLLAGMPVTVRSQ